MLTVVLVAKVKAGHEDEFETRMARLFESIAAEPGCRGATWGPTETPGEYALVERYANADALAAHRESDHMKEQSGAVAGLFDGPPTLVRFTERRDL